MEQSYANHPNRASTPSEPSPPQPSASKVPSLAFEIALAGAAGRFRVRALAPCPHEQWPATECDVERERARIVVWARPADFDGGERNRLPSGASRPRVLAAGGGRFGREWEAKPTTRADLRRVIHRR
jgi:hypothetical protein